MITLDWLYVLAGLAFAAFAISSAFDKTNRKRFGNAAFWGLLATSFFFGGQLSDLGNGILVLMLVGLAGFGMLGRGDPPTTSASARELLSVELGNRIFLPALIIPVTAFAGTLLYNYTAFGESGLFEERWVTLILLGTGVLVALAVCMAWLKPPVFAPVQEGRRLMDSIGWAAVLPQMLAALGAVFALAGVGQVIGGIAEAVIPEGDVFVAVLIYALGMALFTMVMGNAFAAFPVMAAAVGIPILVDQYGGSAPVIGAIGMLAGFCGTLMTPMAANFNIVPAALLEMKSQYGVIRMQIATAVPLLACNILLIYFLAFR